MNLEKILGETAGSLVLGILIYVLGWLSGEVAERIFSKNHEAKLRRKTKNAIDAIYEAEEAIPKKGQGAERLARACHAYMEKTGEKRYSKARTQVLAVFPLTKLGR